jgi:hypothetical protein
LSSTRDRNEVATSPRDASGPAFDFGRVAIHPEPTPEFDAGTQAKVKAAVKKELEVLPRVEAQVLPRDDDPSGGEAEDGTERQLSSKKKKTTPKLEDEPQSKKRELAGRTGLLSFETLEYIERKNALNKSRSSSTQQPGHGVNPAAMKPRPDDDADVLYLGFNTTTAMWLNLKKEYQAIGEHQKVKVLLNPSVEKLSAMIATGRFKTVIIGGHGLTGQAMLAEKDGSGMMMKADTLADILASNPSVKSVIASFCYSARGDDRAITTNLANRGIDAVGYNRAVYDAYAILAAGELSRLMAEGHSLEEATRITAATYKHDSKLLAQYMEEIKKKKAAATEEAAGRMLVLEEEADDDRPKVVPDILVHEKGRTQAKTEASESAEVKETAPPEVKKTAPTESTRGNTSGTTDNTTQKSTTHKSTDKKSTGTTTQDASRTQKATQKLANHTQVRGELASVEASAEKTAWQKKGSFGDTKGAGGSGYIEAGKASAHGKASVGWAPNKGLQVSGNVGASVVAVGGGFEVHTKPIPFNFGGESFTSRFSFGVDAAVAAEANGHLSLNATPKAQGVEAGISGFAGAKVSTSVTAAVDWNKRPAAAYTNAVVRNVPALLGRVVPSSLLAAVPQEDLVSLIREVMPVLLGKNSGPTMILVATASGAGSLGVGATGHLSAGLRGGVVHCKGRFGVTVGLGLDGELDVQLGMLEGMRLVGVLVARGIEAIVNALRPSKSLPDWLLEQAESIRQAIRAICYRFANDPENGWTARQLVELLGDAL